MEPFLYAFFHEKTNDRTEDGLINIPKDREKWPDSWKSHEFKTYPRLKKIVLPKTHSDTPLGSLLKKRQSAVSHILGQPITLEDVSAFVEAGYGNFSRNGQLHKSVPSGGARYPLELYVAVWGEVADLSSGYYHYTAEEQAFSELPFVVPTKDDVKLFSNDEWVTEAHGVIIVSAVFDRTIRKYGSRGYRYTLLEAGHVGQNICLAAAERDLTVRPLGSFTEEYFEHVLQFDITKERIVYALVF